MRLKWFLVSGVAAFPLFTAPAALAKLDPALCEAGFAKLEKAEAAAPLRLAQATPPKTDADVDKSALTRELSEMLQACSFDGQTIEVAARSLKPQPTILGAVETIMGATGLPQNFEVVEAAVPNAAALIVLDGDNIPRRVIAYNADFMRQSDAGQGGPGWMATSIMAHEIGHHLSGHTLVPGGSMPPLELEADRFSGFVLARLGASQSDAEEAVRSLVPETASRTHPGRADRLQAIASGWNDACADDCGAGTKVAEATPTEALTPAEPKTDVPAPGNLDAINEQLDKIGEKNRAALAGLDRLPAPSADAIPRKFTQFLYGADESFNPEVRAEYEAAARKFAADPGVEIVTIIADDLHGLTATDYARQMLRLLRVGKLDVGNGAVIVAAPGTAAPIDDASGVALGPGLSAAMGPESLGLLERSARDFVESQRREAGVDSKTRAMALTWAADSIMRDHRVVQTEWFVRYPTLAAALRAKAEYDAANKASGASYDPEKDPIWRKIVRARMTLNGEVPPATDTTTAAREKLLGPRLAVTSADTPDFVLHASPLVARLMPVLLESGKTYEMIIRLEGTTEGKPAGTLLSYDEVSEG